MKTTILAILGVALLVGAVGCVSTVSERQTAGIPFIKDKIEARYPRSADQVVQAAKEVVMEKGSLINESTLYSQTNAVRTIEGKVNQRNVWVRVEPIEANTTKVVVQTRTPGGLSDIDLSAQIDKEIALKLVR